MACLVPMRATLSNCGDVLMVPLPNGAWKRLRGQVNDLWYGKNVEHEHRAKWMIRSQVLRLTVGYGCSSQTKWQWALSPLEGLKL